MYFLWRAQLNEDKCVIKLPDIDRVWELYQGKPRLQNPPEKICCRMDGLFSKQNILADSLYGAGMPIISSKLKSYLSSLIKFNNVEFIPVKIINHNGKEEEESFFIVHPLDVLDCINMERSNVIWNQITKNLISGCKHLSLNNDCIPVNSQIFRLKYWGSKIILSNNLVENMVNEGIEIQQFRPIEGYTGIG